MTEAEALVRSKFDRLVGWFRCAAIICLLSLSFAIRPQMVLAQGAPPLRVILLPRLIPDAISQMLPIMFDTGTASTAIQPEKLSVVAMVYCGGDAAEAAYAVGVAVPGQAQALSSTSLSANDCADSLSSTAARLMNSGAGADWLEVIKIRAAWTPWRLILSIADAAGMAKSGFSAPNIKAVGQIKSYDT